MRRLPQQYARGNRSQKPCSLILGVFLTLRPGAGVPVRAEKAEMRASGKKLCASTINNTSCLLPVLTLE